jgi:hypothetical protein
LERKNTRMDMRLKRCAAEKRSDRRLEKNA